MFTPNIVNSFKYTCWRIKVKLVINLCPIDYFNEKWLKNEQKNDDSDAWEWNDTQLWLIYLEWFDAEFSFGIGDSEYT